MLSILSSGDNFTRLANYSSFISLHQCLFYSMFLEVKNLNLNFMIQDIFGLYKLVLEFQI